MILENPVREFLKVELYALDNYQFIFGRNVFGDNFGSEVPSYSWQDYTCDVTNVRISRGGNHNGIVYSNESGTMTLTLKNTQPGEDYKLAAKAKIRLRNTQNNKILFTGKIEDYETTFQFNRNREKTPFLHITATDAISSIAKTNRFGAGTLGENESYEERIARLATSTSEDLNLPEPSETIVRYTLNAQWKKYSTGGGGGFGLPASYPDYDGWTRFGGVHPNSNETEWKPPPEPSNPYTIGLQYTTQIDVGFSAWPYILPANTFGMKRTVSGLTPGKRYTLNATGFRREYSDDMAIVSGTGGHVDQYALGVEGIGQGTPGTIALDTPTALPEYEFVATATSHTITITMTEEITRQHVHGGLQQFELFKEQWDSIELLELGSISSLELQPVNYESTLRNHFDMACNSVGAYWWADSNNIIQFKTALDALGIKAVYTDNPAHLPSGGLAYNDILERYSTRDIVNDLAMVNHGMKEDPDNEGETLVDDKTYPIRSNVSIESYGSRAVTLHTSLHTTGDALGAIEELGKELLADVRQPRNQIRQIVWNAQENVGQLGEVDIFDQIRIHHNGRHQNSRIVKLNYNIQPTRIMVTIGVIPDKGETLQPDESE